MNVTREVVADLLPVYFSGEASADTQMLVEDYFRHDPDFERIARGAARPLENLRGISPLPVAAEREKRDLECVRGELWRSKLMFGVALFLTLAPLAFVYTNGHISWLMVRDAPRDATFYWGMAALLWLVYFAQLRRRTASRVLLFGLSLFFTLEPLSFHSTNGHVSSLMAREGPWSAAFSWSLAALLWFLFFYSARVGRRTAFLVFTIGITLIPIPFVLHYVFTGWTHADGSLGGAAALWICAAFLWALRFGQHKSNSDSAC